MVALVSAVTFFSQASSPHQVPVQKPDSASRPWLERVEVRRLVAVRLAEGFGVVVKLGLDPAQDAGHTGGRLREGELFLVSTGARDHHDLARLDVARSDLEPHRDALQFPLAELVAGAVLVAVVDLHPDQVAGELVFHLVRHLEHRAALLVGLVDRDDHHLDRGESGGQPQTAVVAVGHDHAADHARREPPRRRPRVLQLALLVEELDVVGLGEVLAEEMGRPALERRDGHASGPRS